MSNYGCGCIAMAKGMVNVMKTFYPYLWLASPLTCMGPIPSTSLFHRSRTLDSFTIWNSRIRSFVLVTKRASPS
jgi:hypothetical protein